MSAPLTRSARGRLVKVFTYPVFLFHCLFILLFAGKKIQPLYSAMGTFEDKVSPVKRANTKSEVSAMRQSERGRAEARRVQRSSVDLRYLPLASPNLYCVRWSGSRVSRARPLFSTTDNRPSLVALWSLCY